MVTRALPWDSPAVVNRSITTGSLEGGLPSSDTNERARLAPGSFYFNRRPPVHCGVAPSSMIRGVTKIIRSRRFSSLLLKLNSLPTIGRPERSGMPERLVVNLGAGRAADTGGWPRRHRGLG